MTHSIFKRPSYSLRVLGAVILSFYLIMLVDSTRRVVVYLPPKKIKHFHHHHHHMMLVDPESQMMLPFTNFVQPLSLQSPASHAAKLTAHGNAGSGDQITLIHPHVYKPGGGGGGGGGTNSAGGGGAQNRDFRSFPAQILTYPRDPLQPYVIPTLIPSAGFRRYNFDPIATGPAGRVRAAKFKNAGA